jgi:pectate lyase
LSAIRHQAICFAALGSLLACGADDGASSGPTLSAAGPGVQTDSSPTAPPASGAPSIDPANPGSSGGVPGVPAAPGAPSNEGAPNVSAPVNGGAGNGQGASSAPEAPIAPTTPQPPQVCEQGDGFVSVVFFAGEGCTAACGAQGLQCAQGFENLPTGCGAGTPLALGCAEATHQSDFCVCTADGAPILDPEQPIVPEIVDPEIVNPGLPTDPGTVGPGGGNIGTPAVPPDGTQCRAIGWATRVGRNGGPFAVTGGGNTTPVVVDNFADLQALAAGSEPRVIYIDGPVGNGFRNGTGDRLDIGANKTIAGLRPGTELNAAILISGADSSNIILRNFVINGPGSDGAQSWDNINIASGARNIWVDHCEFLDGQDGNADVVRGADNVTFTWNVFGYRENSTHNFSNLVASSDNEPESVGKLDITLMFNHFRGAEQRTPRCRFGDIHVVNNLFTTDGLASSNGASAGVDCRILTENNHFIGISQPIHVRAGGINELRGQNIFEGTSGNVAAFGGTAFEPPYEYEDILVPASVVRGLLEGRVGATLASPTVCDF